MHEHAHIPTWTHTVHADTSSKTKHISLPIYENTQIQICTKQNIHSKSHRSITQCIGMPICMRRYKQRPTQTVMHTYFQTQRHLPACIHVRRHKRTQIKLYECICVYVYNYMHIKTYTHTYWNMHTNTYTKTQVHHKCMQKYTRRIRTLARTNTYMQQHARVEICVCMPIWTCACMQMSIHTCAAL